MNIVDAIIILTLLTWALTGLKRGFIKQGVMTIGTVIMFILAFFLKNPIAEFLSLNLPFFDFGGALGAPAFNILLYQLISFILVMIILEAILNILVRISGIIEKLLKFTIVLGIPSKILGLILGFIEGVVIVYIVLFFISQPAFKLNLQENSKLTPMILDHVPGLSNIAGGMVNTITDIYDLADQYQSSTDSNQYSLDAIEIMLEHKVITPEYVDKLIQKNKINIRGINTLLEKYR